jgi:ATP-dependent Clp protease adapter protein ClpS
MYNGGTPGTNSVGPGFVLRRFGNVRASSATALTFLVHTFGFGFVDSVELKFA